MYLEVYWKCPAVACGEGAAQGIGDTYVEMVVFCVGVWWGEVGTVAGIYDLRRLQIKRCGRLGLRAVLALDCCPNMNIKRRRPFEAISLHLP